MHLKSPWFFNFVWDFCSRAMLLCSFHWQVLGLGSLLRARGFLVRLSLLTPMMNLIQCFTCPIICIPMAKNQDAANIKHGGWGGGCKNVPVGCSTTWGQAGTGAPLRTRSPRRAVGRTQHHQLQ